MALHLARRSVLTGGTAALAMAPALPAAAQTALPAGNLRMLVGFPAGGGSDVMGRLIADKIKQRTGANIIVENKAGASGMIAAEALKNAPPDGTTIMYTPSATLVARMTGQATQFDPQTDFISTGMVGTVQTSYCVSPTLGVDTMPDYIAWLKKNPGKHSFGTTALGSFTHFVGVMLGNAIGIPLEPVAYRGAAPLISDLSGGHVPAGCGGLTDFLQHHRGGKVKILLTAGGKRAQAAPDIPTATELGYGDILIEGWYTFFAPSRTPASIVQAWNREITAAVDDPEIRDKLVTLGLDVQPGSSAAFTERMNRDLARWKEIIDRIGYKPS